MLDYPLYSAILGLSSEWHISHVTVDEQTGITEIHIHSHKAGMCNCPTCGAGVVPAGTKKTRWLHENHLNFRFLVSALVPLISCEFCGDVKISVPWEKSRSRFREIGCDEQAVSCTP